MDFFAALLGFLLLSPIFIVLALLLSINNKGTPFFVQRRPGKNGKIFSIIKFKTMTNAKDAQGNLLPDADRLTNLGKTVRSLSLDEIPQLLNVIKGDMSLIGPRPLLPEYLSLYSDFQKRRHEVRPGITGYAQVNGRNAITWEKKFELDVYYVEKINFALDLSILFNTIQKVFLRSDINSSETATATRFKGSKEI